MKKDKIVCICQKKGGNKDVINVNIKNKSKFESMSTDLRILYFLIFYNFIDNKSVKQNYLNCKEFAKDLGLESISKTNIIKLYRIIREKNNNNY